MDSAINGRVNLRKEDVSSNVSRELSLQEYKPGKSIGGVRLIDFDLHTDDGGDFHEIARLKNGVVTGLEAFELRQINRSRFNPGLIKAFHLHMKQDEIWVVHPLDRLLVGLLDVREASSTEGTQMRLVLGGGKSRMLYVPLGVAHGGMVLDQRPVDVIYLTNQNFSPSDPDEWRLPWNILGEDFWQIRKG
jgi:dTDP-4-dehydrorhamnose 3,5-epimerase